MREVQQGGTKLNHDDQTLTINSKGTHGAMKSGMVAAESIYEALCDEKNEDIEDSGLDISSFGNFTSHL